MIQNVVFYLVPISSKNRGISPAVAAWSRLMLLASMAWRFPR